jgi:hypothetical protein
MNSIITKQNLTQEIEIGEKEIERGGADRGKQGKEKGTRKGREEKRGIVADRLRNCRVRQTLTLFFKGLALFGLFF